MGGERGEGGCGCGGEFLEGRLLLWFCGSFFRRGDDDGMFEAVFGLEEVTVADDEF